MAAPVATTPAVSTSTAPQATPTLLAQLLAQLTKYPTINPQAEIAVAKQEGLGGGIGDGGHAFGPNQMNNAGGVLTGKFAGETPQQIQDWAWTPAGIDYALAGIAKTLASSGAPQGSQQVPAIVGNLQLGGRYGGFERPLHEGPEIQNALAAYGVGGTPAAGTPAVLTPTPTTPAAPAPTMTMGTRQLASPLNPAPPSKPEPGVYHRLIAGDVPQHIAAAAKQKTPESNLLKLALSLLNS
jgi:hypothetical protein